MANHSKMSLSPEAYLIRQEDLWAGCLTELWASPPLQPQSCWNSFPHYSNIWHFACNQKQENKEECRTLNNTQNDDKKTLFFMKPWLAQRMITETKLYVIWTSLSSSGSKSHRYTKDVTVPPGLQLQSQHIGRKDLLGSCWLKGGNKNCHCPHWHSLWTKGFSIHCHLLFQVWRAQTWLGTKGSSWWSLFSMCTPCTQSPSTIPRYLFSVMGIQTRNFD